MIKLVLSDMDNTLIPLGCKHVSLRTLVAIHALRAEGVEFAPSTGRDRVELLPFFVGDDDYYRTGILSNGKKVYVKGDLVSLRLIDNALVERLVEIVDRYPGCFVNIYPYKTDVSNPVFSIGCTAEEMLAFGGEFRFRGIAADRVPKRQIIGVTVACAAEPEVVEDLIHAIHAEIPELDVTRTFPNWLDILPKGVSKASGLNDLIAAMGIGRDEVAVFGDAENDLSIMSVVPNSVAVANAMDSVKKVARWHVGACADDGVAEAMEQIAQAAHVGGMPQFML